MGKEKYFQTHGDRNMKTTCIAHPANDTFLAIRRWAVTACDGNHCAAALISFFEHWHNNKIEASQQSAKRNKVAEFHGEEGTQDTSFYQFHSQDELVDGVLGMWKKDGVIRAVKILERKGFISKHTNPSKRYNFDRTNYFLFHPQVINEYL
jgi:hypothetical protein